jgi:murein DD-endopeptidase MepM/ murein hydrolase activator NlpD
MINKILKKTITIMLIPKNAASNIKQYDIPLIHILIVLIITIALFSSAITIIIKRVNYHRVIFENKILTNRIDAFSKEIVKLNEKYKKVNELEESLKTLLGMGSKKAIITHSGIGGPKDLTKKFTSQNGENEFKSEIERINKQSDLIESEFREIEKYIGELRSIYYATPLGYPVIGGWITSPFGRRGNEFHRGIDFAGKIGTPIHATADGVVSYSGWMGDYGLLVEITHGYGFKTRYGHNLKNVVKLGDKVKRGQVIAYLGQTGNASGPHVHYEVIKYNLPVNPEKYLKEGGE